MTWHLVQRFKPDGGAKAAHVVQYWPALDVERIAVWGVTERMVDPGRETLASAVSFSI